MDTRRMNTRLPTQEEGSLQANVCYIWGISTCRWQNTISINNYSAISLCINWQNLPSQKACDIVGVPDIVSTEMEQSQWWFCDFLISFLRYYYQYVIFVIIIIIIIIIFLQIYIFFVAGSQ